jgi:hypothetical protein
MSADHVNDATDAIEVELATAVTGDVGIDLVPEALIAR